MTFEYEGIFFISWFFITIILSFVVNIKYNIYYIFLPIIALLLYVLDYRIIFWGDIFLLPLALLTVRKKYMWNWTKYIFYSLFPYVIFELFTNLTSIYTQFLFKQTSKQWYEFYWSELIDASLGFLFCLGCFKLFKVNFKEISKQLEFKSEFKKIFNIFNISLLVYIFSVYMLNNLFYLDDWKLINIAIDLAYVRRNLITLYFVFMIGIIFHINYTAKLNSDRQLSERKNSQIKELTSYSQHIESLYKEIRGFRHDYTNLLSSLNQAIKNRDIDGVENIYNTVFRDSDKQFSSSQYDIANLSNIENDALKSLVSAKMIEAQNKGINLSVEVGEQIDIPTSLELIDLLKIVSIFLDNAIEATVHAEVPYLSFVYFQEATQKIMIIENSIQEEKLNTKSIFQYGHSSKGDNRGIGLSNVTEILSSNPKLCLKTYSENHRFIQEVVFES